MTRIAILDDYQGVAMECADWDSLPDGCTVTSFGEALGDEDAIANRLKDFDVIIGMRERTPFPKSLIDKLPNLKLLITTGLRNMSFDVAAANDQGVVVCGTVSQATPAAELTWGLVLSLFKQIPLENTVMHAGCWQKAFPATMHGKIIGIIGLGKLGSRIAAYASVFGMKVLAWSPNLTQERANEHNATAVSKEALFSDSDLLTIHMPLVPASRGLVTSEDLGRMKSSAYIVNTSRGPIVDENALADACRNRTIAGAGVDVYDVEPLPTDHPFRSIDNMILTGHIGYVTRDNYEGMYAHAIENITGWLDGTPVRVLESK
ncbi:MAG: D-2-hydroxyacid dehydrogenase family protein [Rhodospirillales bacterium]